MGGILGLALLAVIAYYFRKRELMIQNRGRVRSRGGIDPGGLFGFMRRNPAGKRDSVTSSVIGMNSTGYGAVAASESHDDARRSYGGEVDFPQSIDAGASTGGNFAGYGGVPSTLNSYGGSYGTGSIPHSRLYKYVQMILSLYFMCAC